MKISLKSVAIAAALLVSNTVMAGQTAVIATETFQQDKNGALAGQSGGTGWAGNWQSNGGTATVTTTGSDKALQFSAANQNAAYRNLSSTISKDVTIRFEFQYSGGVLENNDFLALWFGTNEGPNIGLKANCGDGNNCTNDGFVRTSAGGAAAPLANSDLIAGQNYVFFGHLYKGAGSTNYNHFDAWINPNSDELLNWSTPDAKATGNSGISSFNQIGFRTDNLALDSGGSVNVLVDDIELSVVPEPASIALMGASMLALAGLRRRRPR